MQLRTCTGAAALRSIPLENNLQASVRHNPVEIDYNTLVSRMNGSFCLCSVSRQYQTKRRSIYNMLTVVGSLKAQFQVISYVVFRRSLLNYHNARGN
jgi:hypothetical protein